MEDAARLIRAFFAAQQPSLVLPDGSWYGVRPNDVVHDLHAVQVRRTGLVIELGGELVRRLGGGMRLALDGVVEVEEVRAPGVHELVVSGFGRCLLEDERRRCEWGPGALRFVGWVAQGRTPPSVLSFNVD